MFLQVKCYVANIRVIKSLTKIDQLHFCAVIGLHRHYAAKIQKKPISRIIFFVFIFIFFVRCKENSYPPFLLGQKSLRSQGSKEWRQMAQRKELLSSFTPWTKNSKESRSQGVSPNGTKKRTPFLLHSLDNKKSLRSQGAKEWRLNIGYLFFSYSSTKSTYSPSSSAIILRCAFEGSRVSVMWSPWRLEELVWEKPSSLPVYFLNLSFTFFIVKKMWSTK